MTGTGGISIFILADRASIREPKKTIKKDLLTVVAGRIFMSYRQELIKGDFES